LKKESVKYFWRFPEEVMTTDKWKKVKQENPDLLCKIQEFVCRNK
jgi:speckle-type POZ protein